jgi:hypothetical protein
MQNKLPLLVVNTSSDEEEFEKEDKYIKTTKRGVGGGFKTEIKKITGN